MKRQYKNWKFLDSKILNKIPASGILQCVLKYIKTELYASQEYKDCLMREKSIKESALLGENEKNIIISVDEGKPFAKTTFI